MKYDVLERLREQLHNKYKSKATAATYYFAVSKLFKDMQFENASDIDSDLLKSKLKMITKKNNFSAAKNGLKALKEIEPSFDLPSENFFKQVSLKKKNRTTRKKDPLIKDKTQRKINGLNDDRYKLAFRLMLKTGLRVSEVSGIKKENITINGNHINILLEKTKGGKQAYIEFEDEYLSKKIPQLIDGKSEKDNIFPATSTLKNKANNLGIECHDLRRIAAIEYKASEKKDGKTEEEANEATKDFLRHDRYATTKRYTENKKLIYKSKAAKLSDVYSDLKWNKKEQAYQEDILNKFKDRDLNSYQKLIDAEPKITKNVQDITEDNGGELIGLEYRVKTPSSIYEKMQGRDKKTKVSKMNDIIRYTALFDPDILADCTNKVLADFESKGYRINKVKNTWNDEYASYKGINITMVTPKSEMFEFQVHTKESFKLKNGELHKLYEEARILKKGDPREIEILQKMFVLSSKLVTPKNIKVVKNK